MKAGNKKRDSFSMAFLRVDSIFSQFPSGYETGFIVYPHLLTPRNKHRKRVYCAFPVDGHTDGRRGHGCGQSRKRDDPKGTSKHCNSQGINSFDKWFAHYNKIVKRRGYFVRKQCAFDMTKKTAARDFEIILRAKNYMQNSKYGLRNNEILFHDWKDNDPKDLPIEAFFFLENRRDGYKKAKRYQEDYRRLSGEVIPIVGITLPSPSNQYRFHVQSF